MRGSLLPSIAAHLHISMSVNWREHRGGLPGGTGRYTVAPARFSAKPEDPLPLEGRRILLIIADGIAAYKSLDLIRRLRERGAGVRVIMTRAAQQFVMPLAAAALSAERVYSDLF